MCVCVRERERERELGTRKRDTERVSLLYDCKKTKCCVPQEIAQMFQSVGMCEQAVEAYIKVSCVCLSVVLPDCLFD